MYDYITGSLQKKSPTEVVIDVQGIGYICSIPLSTFSSLPSLNSVVKLHTVFIVREDAQLLYGFFTEQEKKLFLLVKDLSGIGPKTALALIGHIDLALFTAAIQEQKKELITKVPGIGPKTAGRILIEMQDKLSLLASLQQDQSLQPMDLLSIDAVAALVNLGYKQVEAKKAVESVRKEHTSLNTLLPAALQKAR